MCSIEIRIGRYVPVYHVFILASRERLQLKMGSALECTRPGMGKEEAPGYIWQFRGFWKRTYTAISLKL